MSSKIVLLSILLSFFCTVFAERFDHIVLYKDHGSWKSNVPVIPEGKPDAGRINWRGQRLIFTPENGDFNTGKTALLGFMIQVPKEMTRKRFTVKLSYRDGRSVTKTFATPVHTGWQANCFYFEPITRVMGSKVTPAGLKGALKQIEFKSAVKNFKAVIDDIHFNEEKPSEVFAEHLFPQVTKGCYFPEFTRADTIAEVLADPEFKTKMAEIEKLRKIKLPFKLRNMQSAEKQKIGIETFAKIRDDGSFSDLTYADGERIQREKKYHHNTNETYLMALSARFRDMINYWRYGRVPRTEENRKKMYKALVRYIATDANRRCELSRYVCPGFVIPKVAADAYCTFFDDMEAVEQGTNRDPLAIRLNRALKEAASWCYTFPINRATAPFLTVDSFRFSTAWTGGNFGYRPAFHTALICRNPRMMDVIAEITARALEPISYNTRKEAFWTDGITPDGSAWGHGPQNYPFGYPLSGISVIGELLKELRGTRWEQNAGNDIMNNVCNYFEGTMWHGGALRRTILQRDLLIASGRIGQRYRGPDRGYDDFSVLYRTMNKYTILLPEKSPERKRLDRCKDIIRGKAPLPVGTRYFWNNNLMICREKNSAVAVTMLSSRVNSCENAKSASHLADFWSDGSAWINKPLTAYRTAKGFFRQSAIPGVTARQWKFDHKKNYWRTYTGKYDFAGGVTNGNFAVCGYQAGRHKLSTSPDPNFYDLEARKAYFWLDGKLLCLTAGITDKTRRNVQVATTLDQTLWRAPITYGNGKTAKPGEKVKADTNLLWHDGIGYAVLRGKGVLSAETRKERWKEFDAANKNRKDLPQTAPILMFQIDHGKNPRNGTGAYMVDLNCKDFASLKKFADTPSVEIIALTPDVQAVRERSSGTFAAVIHTPGGKAGDLQAEYPAVVLLREFKDGRVQVTVSDPLQDPKRDEIVLKWKNKYYRIKLPTGVYSGKPVTVFLDKKNNIKNYKMKKVPVRLSVEDALSGSAKNLLKNADFQQTDSKGRTASWRMDTRFFKRVKDTGSGKSVIKTTLDIPAGAARLNRSFYQNVKIDAPGKYVIAITGKIVDHGRLNVLWDFIDAQNRRIKAPSPWWTATVPSNNKWQRSIRQITIPENIKSIRITITCRLEKEKSKTGTMLIREVKLVPLEVR